MERSAQVQAGDQVRVLDRPAHGVTVADVMAAMIGDRDRVPLVAAARDDLGERGRDWLDRTLFNLRRRARAADRPR